MALALYKAAEYWKMSAGFKGFTLVKVLIEDQIVYFLLYVFLAVADLLTNANHRVISCSVFSILEFKLQISDSFLVNVLEQLGSPSFLSLLGSRLLFNMKEAGERGQNEGTSYRSSSSTISEMDFAEPVRPQRYYSFFPYRRDISEYFLYRESETEHSGSEEIA